MTFPDPDRFKGGDPSRDGTGPASCAPVRGPDRRAVRGVKVDDDLVWVTRVPGAALGAALPASPGSLVHLRVRFAADLAAAWDAELEAALTDDELVDAAARAVAGYLADLPDLPLIGEPFGGEEGTD